MKLLFLITFWSVKRGNIYFYMTKKYRESCINRNSFMNEFNSCLKVIEFQWLTGRPQRSAFAETINRKYYYDMLTSKVKPILMWNDPGFLHKDVISLRNNACSHTEQSVHKTVNNLALEISLQAELYMISTCLIPSSQEGVV